MLSVFRWSAILKRLLVVCLAAAVVAGGVKLFQMRYQLFRPDAGKVGGTELIFAAEGAPDEEDLARTCAVLRKRFDPIGAAGVEVRPAGPGRIAVLVPHGKRHDDLVDRVRRLSAVPGRLELGLLAHELHEREAVEEARKRFLAEGDGPATTGERARFSVRLAGGERRHCRWARVSDTLVHRWGLDLKGRDFLPPGTPRAVIPSHVVFFPIFARREGGARAPEYFVLVRVPDPGREVTGEGLNSVRLRNVNRSGSLASIEFTCTDGGGERLFELTARHVAEESGPRRLRHAGATLAIVLDGELIGDHFLVAPLRRKGEIALSTSRPEDTVALMGGGSLPIRLREKPVAEHAIPPSK